jgi:uncharacterized repeat protein (TIGR01451 family)
VDHMVKRSRRVALASGLVGLVGVLALMIAGAATADQGYNGPANQVYEAGNPSCPAGTADAGSTKIDGGDLNGYQDSRIHITRHSVQNGIDSIDWALVDDNLEVMAVIVKGGDGAYIYYYDALGGSEGDNNLAPPLNGGNQAPQISHVEFCFDPKEAPNPDLKIEKSASGTSQITHSWSVDKQVKLAGASDATYGDNATLNLPDGGSGSVTWKVTVTHTQVQTYAVTGTITVSNEGEVAVTGVDVSDSIPGASIDCAGNGSTNLTVPAGGSVQCSYSVAPGTQVDNNTATASWGSDHSVSTTATIQWANPTETGAEAHVSDTGQVDENLDTGDLENNQWSTTYNEGWRCSSGKPSPNNGRTNVATVTWNNGTDSDSSSASVQVGCGSTPPPQPPVTPPHGPESMDLQVVKNATQHVELANGQADIAYTVVVTNNGPNQAHNVVVSDPAPGGVTFLTITKQPDAPASCTLSAAVLNCTLGDMGPGVVQTIGLSARVTQAGTYTNCATVVGDGGDTNSANNTGCAETVVTAPAVQPVTPPFTPPVTPKPKPKPKVKPTPKPAANLCRVLKVNTKMVKANGHKHGIIAKVTRSRNPVKGVKVRFTGAGVNKAARTNTKGVARITVKTNKAGIIRVHIVNKKACNTARIGVVGVFQPPVTG